MKKVYIDQDGSNYCNNRRALWLCAENIKNEGDVYWDLCMGLIADWNSSRKALGMSTIRNPKTFLREIVKSCS